MPRKSRKNKSRMRSRLRRQKPIIMIGCNCKRSDCKRSHSKRRRTHKNKKGGSGCGSCGCPIAPLSYKQMNQFGGYSYGPILGIGQNGGSFYKPAGPIPGPFVGSPWTPDSNMANSNNNYFSRYDLANDPQLQMKPADVDAGYRTPSSMVGGYTYKNAGKSASSSKKVGGGLIPQDLLNLGRDFSYNIKSAYNSLNGYDAPVNPLPYKDQYRN